LLRLHVFDIVLSLGKPHAALLFAVRADSNGHIGHFRFRKLVQALHSIMTGSHLIYFKHNFIQLKQIIHATTEMTVSSSITLVLQEQGGNS